jgi:GH24 family phage-related lysozyme (muramidase)
MASAQYTVMKHVHAPMTDGQFAALADFVFNVGSSNFSNSTLLKVVNENKDDQVRGQFQRWVMAGGKSWTGLVKRREREISVYFEGRPVPRAAPTLEESRPIDIRIGE